MMTTYLGLSKPTGHILVSFIFNFLSNFDILNNLYMNMVPIVSLFQIDIDFITLYSGKETNFFQKFEMFKEKLKKLIKMKKISSIDINLINRLTTPNIPGMFLF